MIACLLAVTIISHLNKPDIKHVYLAKPSTSEASSKDIARPPPTSSEAASATIRVMVEFGYTSVSTGRIRILPEGCIQAIAINGVDVPDVRNIDRSWKCSPNSYTIDLSQHLRLGVNTAEMQFTGGSSGITIVGHYSQYAVLAMAALAGLALFAGKSALLQVFPDLRTFPRSTIGRICVMSFLPCLGMFTMWATIANRQADWPQDHIATTLVVVIVPFALLLRLFSESSGTQARIWQSYAATAISLATVAYASVLLAERGWSGPEIQAIASIGVVTGFFACVPLCAFLKWLRNQPRTVAVTFVAALSPHAYWHLNTPLWGEMSGVTSAMVRGILWVSGYPTTTFTGNKKDVDGQITDYFAYVSSSDFSVQIGSWCSGFEGVSLFIILLSAFVLLDWKLFSKVRHLWAAFVLTIPFVLVMNAMRIAGLFLYAEWNVWRHGRTQAVWATIEAFHSNVGWVVYSLAFALLLPLVYRWARIAAKVS